MHDEHVIVEIRTTVPRREAAIALAERLVTEGLAACVQVDGPMTSIYRWQGVVEQTVEFRCTCKTTEARAAACTAAILADHEYDTPEVLVGRFHGAPAYAAWVRETVAPPA